MGVTFRGRAGLCWSLGFSHSSFHREDRLKPGLQRELLPYGRSMMHDGLVCFTGSPVTFSLPVFVSIANTAMLFPGMFAHNSHTPSGVIARFCGPFPRLGSIPSSVSLPSLPML